MSIEGGALGGGHGRHEVIAWRVHEEDPFAHPPILSSRQPAGHSQQSAGTETERTAPGLVDVIDGGDGLVLAAN